MDLDTITLVTYICAALGVLLLTLCIVLAFFVICGFCKKCFTRQAQVYSVVPPTQDPLDIEHAVLQRYHINTDAMKGLTGVHLIDVDEVDAGSNLVHAAPIKRKLFWKKKKDIAKLETSTMEDTRFSDEELNAGRPKHFFKKKKQTTMGNRKKSKSDWYIYSRCHNDPESLHESEDEDHEALLYPHQVISLIGSPVRPEDLKQSQYFDAMETIREEVDEIDEGTTAQHSNDSDGEEWLSDDEEESVVLEKKVHDELQQRQQRQQPARVLRRVKALKRLQFETEKLESQFYRELFFLESKFNLSQRQPLHEKRNQVLNKIDSHGGTNGVEHFWLQAMQNCETLNEIIQIHDVPVLKYLTDIRIVSTLPSPGHVPRSDLTDDPLRPDLTDEPLEFRIDFHFSLNNPYFENRILTKEYFLKCEPDPAMPFTFEGPEVVSCRGCKILWRKGKNVTLQPVKKVNKETGQLVTKYAKRNSFFNFFTPPQTVREWILDPKKSALMEAHFEIGLFFKETFVSKATLFFASYCIRNLGQEAETSTASRKNLKIKTQQTGKSKKPTSIVKRPDSSQSQFSANSDTSKRPTSFVEQNLTNFVEQISPTEETRPEFKGEEPNHTRAWYQLKNGGVPSPTESKSQPEYPTLRDDKVLTAMDPAPDPIIGKYHLVSSQGFDEFLKALGVGIIKRKLANSVSPIIIVDVDRNGLYTVRTETHVTTVELKFHLNEPFLETTMDGRNVQTTATRNGNTLILDQKGDKSKEEKDSRLVRDFDGKIMNMTMIVDNVVCKRIYQKIVE